MNDVWVAIIAASALTTSSILTFTGSVFAILYARNERMKRIKAETKKTHSETANIDADTIQTMQETISRLVDDMVNVERENRSLKNSIASIQHDAKIDRQKVIELEKRLQEWNEGIQILITQIEEGHDSIPNWRPKET